MAERWAVVTGAGSGIGLEIARELRSRGYSILASSRHEHELSAVASELGCDTFAADLSERSGTAALCDRIDALGSAPDVHVNCAGLGAWGEHLSLDPSRIDATIAVNVAALTTLTTHVARKMAARGEGRVLNVASTAAFQPVPMFAVYGATKHYVRAFSEALAEELAQSNVTVTVLYPGPTRTPFVSAASFPVGGSTGSFGWMVDRMLLDPRDVARSGVDAMLRGERSVVVGALNKLQHRLSAVLPDRATAALWNALRSRS